VTLNKNWPDDFDQSRGSLSGANLQRIAEKPLIKFSITPQRTRSAKWSLIAIIIAAFVKTAFGFTPVELIECLAIFQQLPPPLQISIGRPPPRGCGQILAIISGSINLALAKYQLPKTLSLPPDALRLHDCTSYACQD